DCPDQNACSKPSAALRKRANSMVLSMAIAHTHTEHMSSPLMTVLTSQCACQNRWKSDKSEEVNGKADVVRSAAFIGASFQQSARTNDGGSALRRDQRQ